MTLETKRQERGLRRIELILDVAEDVFAEVGYDAATTNLIAARAGISPGSLYQFFANKQAIAEALADRYVALMSTAQDVALDLSIAELPLDEMVDVVVDAMLAFNLRHPGAKSLLSGADISPALAESTKQLHEAIHTRLEQLVSARAPDLPARKRALAATVSAQIYKGLLPSVLAAAGRERTAIVGELKAALVGYWQTIEQPKTGRGG